MYRRNKHYCQRQLKVTCLYSIELRALNEHAQYKKGVAWPKMAFTNFLMREKQAIL